MLYLKSQICPWRWNKWEKQSISAAFSFCKVRSICGIWGFLFFQDISQKYIFTTGKATGNQKLCLFICLTNLYIFSIFSWITKNPRQNRRKLRVNISGSFRSQPGQSNQNVNRPKELVYVQFKLQCLNTFFSIVRTFRPIAGSWNHSKRWGR